MDSGDDRCGNSADRPTKEVQEAKRDSLEPLHREKEKIPVEGRAVLTNSLIDKAREAKSDRLSPSDEPYEP